MDMRSAIRIVVAAAVVALAASCSSGDTADPPSSGKDASSPTSPNPGLVFEGTYEATQVPEVRPDVTPTPPEFLTSVVSVKSFCTNDSGPCVASALSTYPNIDPPPAPQPIILDYVDGAWMTRSSFAGTCTTQTGASLTAPQWQTTTLTQPDGVTDGSVLTGTGLIYTGAPCAKQFSNSYSFTRTGPLDPALQIPPPDAVPPLIGAAGAALTGSYDVALTPMSAPENQEIEPANASGTFDSFCTRTGDKCAAVFDGDNEVVPMLEWSGDSWSSNAVYAPGDCADGSGQQVTTIRVVITREDTGDGPAQALSGDLRKIYEGDCPGESAWTVALTRTGD